jgi:hypothetical protein
VLNTERMWTPGDPIESREAVSANIPKRPLLERGATTAITRPALRSLLECW